MCLIAVRREDKEKLYEKYFDVARDRNRDGIGIMYAKQGRVIAKKLEGKALIYEKMKLYKEFASAPAPSCLHLRFGTAGNKDDETNAHPFKILSKDDGDGVDLYMMHNGHFSDVVRVDSTKSDTWHFANLYVKKLVKKNPFILCDPFVQDLLSKYTKGSRVVFLYGDGTRVILDDGTGTEDDAKGGAWLSNKHTTEGSPYESTNKWTRKEKVEDKKEEYKYDPDDWKDDYCYGYSHRANESKSRIDYSKAGENVLNMNKDKKQEDLELNRAKYPLALANDDEAGDKDTDNPEVFGLSETAEEAMLELAGMNDDDIKKLVEVQPEDVISLLLNFRDFYIYHSAIPLSKAS